MRVINFRSCSSYAQLSVVPAIERVKVACFAIRATLPRIKQQKMAGSARKQFGLALHADVTNAATAVSQLHS